MKIQGLAAKSYRRRVIVNLSATTTLRQSQIAQAVGVSQAWVSQVLTAFDQQGEPTLEAHPAKGASRKLSEAQLAELPTLLHQGAPCFGFEGDRWTCKRVSQLIYQRFGIVYSPRHVGRLLHQLGYSRQQPSLVEPKQDAQQVRQWQEADFPALKKS